MKRVPPAESLRKDSASPADSLQIGQTLQVRGVDVGDEGTWGRTMRVRTSISPLWFVPELEDPNLGSSPAASMVFATPT